MTTPLEVAHALRQTAAWVRDPASPKVSGSFAVSAKGHDCDPLDPQAARFCAYGHLSRALNFRAGAASPYALLMGVLPAKMPGCGGVDRIWSPFDEGVRKERHGEPAEEAYERCAAACLEAAAILEARIGETTEPASKALETA